MDALASVLHRLADAVSPPEDPPPMHRPPGVRDWSDQEEAREARSQMALSILDDETLGVVVVSVRAVSTGQAHVVVSGEVRDELWPPIARTLWLLEQEARRV